MKVFLVFLVLISFVFLGSCTKETTDVQPATWDEASAGWEDSVAYRAGDDEAKEMKVFEERYGIEKGNSDAEITDDMEIVDGHKVVICFIPPGNPDAAHTIVVDYHAAEGFIEKGSYYGECPEAEEGWEHEWEEEAEEETATETYSCTATEVIEVSQGLSNKDTAVAEDRSNPENALGTPQDNDTINFFALGFGGYAIFGFDGVIPNGEGNDFKVVETSYGSPSCESYPEYVTALASQDGETWIELGTGCQDSEFDLGVLEYAKYIKLVDATDPTAFGATVDGYDIDGIEANCIAEPADGDDTGDLDDLIGDGDDCFDQLDSLPIDISIEYPAPNAGWMQGYHNFFMGTNLCYDIIVSNTGNATMHHLEIGSMFEYLETDELLAGEPVQVWSDVSIEAGATIVLEDCYVLDYGNIATWFQTHVMVRKYSGRCVDGAIVFDNPELGIIYDPIPED